MDAFASSRGREADGDTNVSREFGTVDLLRMAAEVDTVWVNRIVARVDDYVLRLVVQENTSPWHHHPDGDELFVVLTGRYAVDLADREVVLGPGQAFSVPRTTLHRTRALERSVVLCVEAADNDIHGRLDAAVGAPRDDAS
jgi:mannose-6-phosphate isomerase-like protein (cupin superfamily)